MQVAEINSFLKEPWKMNKEHLSELKNLTGKFPYFHAAHLLQAFNSAKFDPAEYQNCIKKAAVSVPNREQLYELLHLTVPETVSEEVQILPVKDKLITEEVKELTELKSAELSSEPITVIEEKSTLTEKEADTKNINKQEAITKEIERSVEKAIVESFVEAQILKTNEAGKKPEKLPEKTDFSSWLSLLKNESEHSHSEIIQPVKEASAEDPGLEKRKIKQKALIDKIIDLNPGSIRLKEDQKFFRSEHNAKDSLLENEHLVTETLASIYASTGNISKAIRAYEILSLKFPQKSVYFASLIQKLKSNSKNE